MFALKTNGSKEMQFCLVKNKEEINSVFSHIKKAAKAGLNFAFY